MQINQISGNAPNSVFTLSIKHHTILHVSGRGVPLNGLNIYVNSGGIDSSSAHEKNNKSSEKDKSELPLYNNSDDEMEVLCGMSVEKEDTHGTPKSQNPTNRSFSRLLNILVMRKIKG